MSGSYFNETYYRDLGSKANKNIKNAVDLIDDIINKQKEMYDISTTISKRRENDTLSMLTCQSIEILATNLKLSEMALKDLTTTIQSEAQNKDIAAKKAHDEKQNK